MPIKISSRFTFELDQATDVLLQFEAAALPDQDVVLAHLTMSEAETMTRVPAQDNIGERIWIQTQGLFNVEYDAEIAIDRQVPDMASLAGVPPHMLPGEAVQYLLDSRYCRADQFQHFVGTQFGASAGGERTAAICDWVRQSFSYTPGASNVSTDAAESFITRQGICRDYAHMVITLARASAIPARYVACYAPGVCPQDFHAVAEVFLADPANPGGGAWQLIDATGMADPQQTVRIGVGRDAADVSFLTSFGPNRFLSSAVDVQIA